jgi:hypothetical protein
LGDHSPETARAAKTYGVSLVGSVLATTKSLEAWAASFQAAKKLSQVAVFSGFTQIDIISTCKNNVI